MQLFNWGTVKEEVVNPKMRRRIISGEKAMVAEITIDQGAIVPLHQHESEQISYALEGALRLELQGQEVVLRPGDVLVIPSNVPHSAVALEDYRGYDIFSPIRIDWLTGKDDYLRQAKG
ncbi:MAG: cupin domain-containing protein [Acidobacteriia bacterium]|nr:cupin domain-containing protein [Terriglobia bacterium]